MVIKWPMRGNPNGKIFVKKMLRLFVITGFCWCCAATCFAKTAYRCHMCGMDAAKSQTEFVATLSDGSMEHTCCLHCVFLLEKFFSKGRKVLKLEVRDFKSGELTDAGRAFYLEGSSWTSRDSMAPFLPAFLDKTVAGKYQKKYGGNLVNFTEAMKIVSQFDEEVT